MDKTIVQILLLLHPCIHVLVDEKTIHGLKIIR